MSRTSAKKPEDRREIPAYPLTEAAHYLRMPQATLRSWVAGRHYPTERGRRFFKPLITPPEEGRLVLSFINLVEAHVLDAIRRLYEIPLYKVRKALDYLQKTIHSKHPLAEEAFETDGMDLFIRKFGELVNVSKDGQLEMQRALESYLKRIDRDSHGLPLRLYPFTRRRELTEPKVVVIDPQISFGRPVLAGTGIPTAEIAERFNAGEKIEELAEDYGRRAIEIEEAIRCERPLEAA